LLSRYRDTTYAADQRLFVCLPARDLRAATAARPAPRWPIIRRYASTARKHDKIMPPSAMPSP
jgi:hypothetical protein